MHLDPLGPAIDLTEVDERDYPDMHVRGCGRQYVHLFTPFLWTLSVPLVDRKTLW